MTTPGISRPDGAFEVGSGFGRDTTEAGVRSTLKAGPIGSFQQAQNNFRGYMRGIDNVIVDTSDAQLYLNDRVDLLSEVSGYATAFLGQNWNLPSNRSVVLPFNRQLGPVKNTSVNNSTGIVLKSKGLWRIDAMLTQTASVKYTYTSYYYTTLPGGMMIPIPYTTDYYVPVGVRYRIEVIRQRDSALLSGKTFNQMPDSRIGSSGITAPQSSAFSHTFVVDINPSDPGTWCLVRIGALAQPGPATSGNDAGTDFKCKVHGGTMLSSLTASRWSVDIPNYQYVPAAPDGGTL